MYFKNIVGVQNLDILNRACTGVYKVMYDYWIKWLTNFTYMYYQVINNLWRKRYTGKSKNDTKGDLWACYIWEYCGTYLTIYSFNVKFLTSHFKTWFYSYFRGTENLHLAVLHPRKIAVYKVGGASLLKIHNFCSQNDKFYIFKKLLHLIYSYYTKKIFISVTSGAVEHGRHFQLNMSFEHNLKRTAFNFCFGPFGGVKGKCCILFSFQPHSCMWTHLFVFRKTYYLMFLYSLQSVFFILLEQGGISFVCSPWMVLWAFLSRRVSPSVGFYRVLYYRVQ